MTLRYVIYGAGGIGGTIGSRLHQAGCPVTLIARGEHAQVMQRQGLRLVSPRGVNVDRITVVTEPGELDFDPQTMVLLCMKSQHTEDALRALSLAAGAHVNVACVQNGVANERAALRYFRNVYATVVNLPAMFLTPGEVVTHAQGQGGILDTGRFPTGVDAVCETMVRDLTNAGFSARPDPAVMRQKYAKLLLNLANVLQAGLADMDAAGGISRAMRREAVACFAAAGIDCATREEAEARREGVYRMARIEGYERTAGSSWQSVARGTGDIETEYLNGEICLLGRLHGVPTPVNDACVRLGRALVSTNQGPGHFRVADLEAWLA